ncbi:YhcN/YlaJ family sporulation lipoprotein [Aeribacillus pallidus]
MVKLRKWILSLGVVSITALAACAANTDDEQGLFYDSGNTINVQNRDELYNENDNYTTQQIAEEFGFVRHQKSPIMGDTVTYDNMYLINREKAADAISKMSVTLPNVTDCSTLVTDEEVLIAYRTKATDDQSRFEVADQVKKTAMSVVPRWYHVYVTDDPQLLRDVENLSNMDADMRNANAAIEKTIELMLERSPQGQNMSDGENPNGEMINEMTDRTDRFQTQTKMKSPDGSWRGSNIIR